MLNFQEHRPHFWLWLTVFLNVLQYVSPVASAPSPTASYAGCQVCGEVVRPRGASGRLISVKRLNGGIYNNQAVPLGNLREADIQH